jgi:tricorn protease-like protein
VYPADSIPVDIIIANELTIVNTYTTLESSVSQKNSKMNKIKSFRVRDKGRVCVVHLPTDRFQLNKAEIMVIDFRNGEQNCLAVKSSLMILEKKTSDDSVLQVSLLYCFYSYNYFFFSKSWYAVL